MSVTLSWGVIRDIDAGAERLAIGPQRDRSKIGAGDERVHRLAELAHHREIEDIHRRAVQRDRCDASGDTRAEMLVLAHAGPLTRDTDRRPPEWFAP